VLRAKRGNLRPVQPRPDRDGSKRSEGVKS